MIDTYNKYKESPPKQRGTPPVVGNILWAKQLLQRLVNPMEFFSIYSSEQKTETPILLTDHGKML